MKRSHQAVLILSVLGWTAAVAYKTGRGDRYDARDQIASLSRRARAAEEALQVADDAWAACVLSEPIRFPEDTALRRAAR